MSITKSADTPITYANMVGSVGIFQGVFNVELVALNWSSTDDGKTVAPDPVVTGRLRLTLDCARQMYQMLGERLASYDAKTSPANGSAEHGLDHAEKLN